jgi:NADH-quinone oxidoreductase subunit N
MLLGQVDTFTGPSIDWYALSPLLILLGGGLTLLVLAALTPTWPRGFYALATCVTAGAAGVMASVLWDDISDEGDRFLVAGALRFDRFSMFITLTVCVSVILATLLTDDFLRREQMDGPEVYGLYLMSAIGGIVMGAANDLVVLFLGLETLSIALYVLAASNRKRIESQESGLKYFILGGFSSAFLLYGIALVYGYTGTTKLIAENLPNPEFPDLGGTKGIFDSLASSVILDGPERSMLLAGIGLLLVGLLFKVAAVPFHWWAADVYEGAPSPVTAFMASAAKAAGFAALLRVLTYGLASQEDSWKPVIWVAAMITIIIGSVMAVVQTNVKRMLAYSSISHAGFILIGIEAVSDKGTSGALFYLMSYAILVCGTFGVVTLIARTGDGQTDLASFRGLGKQHPVLGFAMVVFLLAQAGMPLTSGFVAKFGVIAAAVERRSYALAVVAMVAAVIGAFLYLRIIVTMYFTDAEAGDEKREAIRIPLSAGVAIGVSLIMTLVIGFSPAWLIDLAEDAVPRLIR